MSRCLYKKEIQFVSYNLGDSWYATGESRKGSLIAQGSSLCEEPSYKFQATYSGGATYNEECDSGTTLTQEDTQPSGYTYTRMTSAVIGDCITSIGDYAFQGMNDGYCFVSLRSVDIPDSVTSIGEGAFNCCQSLSSITIPNSVTSIGKHAFLGCYSLSSVTIGSGVTSIGNDAFNNCSSLSSVTIPNSVTSIGIDAFANCDSLKSINIPNSVTSIGDCAFRYCPSLSSMTVGSNNAVYDSRNNCNGIIETATNTLIAGCKNTVIPNTVTKIDSAFEGCSNLSSITIPDSVTYIGSDAFRYCSGLTSITIPDSVTYIGSTAFHHCDSLTSITIPSGVTYIGVWAIAGCSGLTSITCLATTPPTLDNFAFDNTNNCPVYVPCESVSAYQSAWSDYTSRIQGIPPCGQFNGKFRAEYTGGATYTAACDSSSTLTTADTRPSGYVYSAMTSAVIGDCVTSIGSSAFTNCRNLSTIDIPNSVTSIGSHAFDNCWSLSSITIPSGITTINQGTFNSCTSLTSITIPNSVTSIGSEGLSYCHSLTSIDIPNSVTSIDNTAFAGCINLTGLTIGSGVTSIGIWAFANCSSLQSITILATAPPTLSLKPFDNTNDCPIYVPAASVSAYQSAWSTYVSRIQAIQ